MNSHIYSKAVLVGSQRTHSGLPLARQIRDAATAAFGRLLAWQDRASSRRMLRGLDDHMLRDIGIDRATADSEGSTPLWR